MNRALVACTIAALLCSASAAIAQQAFKTPDEAASALASAAKAGDMKALATVLGPDGDDIVSSGDEVADAATREKFVAAYDARHRIAMEGDDTAIMVIGPDDFPVPIPLVRKVGSGASTRPPAERKFSSVASARTSSTPFRPVSPMSMPRTNTPRRIAPAPASTPMPSASSADPGRRTGSTGRRLGEDPSPLGEFVAQATAQGYRVGGGRTPYHGYYFKILTRQGPAAPGGELDYVVRGNMIGGFALVAYPAEYRNSGVMTFLVTHAGTGISERPRAGHGQAGGANEFVQSRSHLANGFRHGSGAMSSAPRPDRLPTAAAPEQQRASSRASQQNGSVVGVPGNEAGTPTPRFVSSPGARKRMENAVNALSLRQNRTVHAPMCEEVSRTARVDNAADRPRRNVRLGGQIPRSARVARGFPRIGDFARSVQRL